MKRQTIQGGLLAFILGFFFHPGAAQPRSKWQNNTGDSKINLAGEWRFGVDPGDKGEQEQWFQKELTDKVRLPGSMATNGKGEEISLQTPWTGTIFDSSWFFKPQYAKYRQPGNIKVPFWLQPRKYYKGAAWYQKEVSVPASWKGKHLELYLERSHWETTVWVDDWKVGMQNSLGTAQVFDLGGALSPGTHRLTVRVDNRIKEVNVGQNSHSITDHTQTNWNGMVGQLYLATRPSVYLEEVQLYPDVRKKIVAAKIRIKNASGSPVTSTIRLQATSLSPGAPKLAAKSWSVDVKGDSALLEAVYPMGDAPLLWDEFHPNLYSLQVQLTGKNGGAEEKNIPFGMREFAARGTQFNINGRPIFLRGTLECAIFPLTGYPATDIASWMRIFRIARSFGLNHMRFHSWCPPEAAFEAADRAGFYLQVECSSWANWGTTLGDGAPVDAYIYEESERMIRDYGNHPSFCMLTYGNEPAGTNHVPYLKGWVNYWKNKDNRRLYTAASAWPALPDNEYQVVSEPRIQLWEAGLKSVINRQPPRTDYDWSDTIARWKVPVVGHEIGQWCVYPDFKEIKKYTGVVQAKNFEIFWDQLQQNGLGHLADSFLLASGKLQALCYKSDIEAALRTKGFGGFQLLDLRDFPGQGTALVGVLNPFWEEKGYITAKEYRRFCNAVVPLARFPKMVYRNNEVVSVPVEVANFGEKALEGVSPSWTIATTSGKVLFRGQLPKGNIPLGNGLPLGEISQSLAAVTQASQLVLTVSVGEYQNSWDLFVYPASLPRNDTGILVTQQWDEKTMETLDKGGKVLLTMKKGSVRPEKGGSVAVGFSSIFWNTACTKGQAPHTLGILCNPQHPALAEFPTAYHSNWQWWDAMSHSDAVLLDSVAPGLQPIVRVVDDWATARPLGLIFECRVGKGRLLVSGIDLLTDKGQRPEAGQLLHSLQQYMSSSRFQPQVQVAGEKISALLQ
ncbi:sugar-binding domain-containing protein [Paraflavisolibacter sp. H34]|uniref:sugar-binding domain-containing protein n=1 Tax=Huijunlia imazamoxiresistens TaxID=3127457 RepID=UPI00301A3A87